MNEEAKKFHIKTVADFARIPDASLDKCLRDFKLWIALVKMQASFSSELDKAFEVPAGSIHLRVEGFTWCDDGNEGCSGLRFETVDGDPLGELKP